MKYEKKNQEIYDKFKIDRILTLKLLWRVFVEVKYANIQYDEH